MRITFVLPYAGLSGGIRMVATYAEFLRTRGHDVCAVSVPRRDLPLVTKLKCLVRGRGWPARPDRGLSHFDDVGVPLRVLERFRPVRDADVPDADVVVATWWETAHWVGGLSAHKGAKLHFVQGDETAFYAADNRRSLAAVRASWALPMAKIAVSQWLVARIRAHCGSAWIDVVPNGVDLGRFNARPRGKRQTPTVGMLYHSHPLKGVGVALRALDGVASQVPGLRLLTFGHEMPVAHLPLPAWAGHECRPAQERIPGIYANCDVWLVPSRSDGFGLPALEALACGTPVVATPVGAVPELLADGGGEIVPVDDANAMADAVVRILRLSDAQWRAASACARSSAEKWPWATGAQMFERALLAAAGRGESALHGIERAA